MHSNLFLPFQMHVNFASINILYTGEKKSYFKKINDFFFTFNSKDFRLIMVLWTVYTWGYTNNRYNFTSRNAEDTLISA